MVAYWSQHSIPVKHIDFRLTLNHLTSMFAIFVILSKLLNEDSSHTYLTGLLRFTWISICKHYANIKLNRLKYYYSKYRLSQIHVNNISNDNFFLQFTMSIYNSTFIGSLINIDKKSTAMYNRWKNESLNLLYCVTLSL